jgi:hypothetical protein
MVDQQAKHLLRRCFACLDKKNGVAIFFIQTGFGFNLQKCDDTFVNWYYLIADFSDRLTSNTSDI